MTEIKINSWNHWECECGRKGVATSFQQALDYSRRHAVVHKDDIKFRIDPIEE